MAAGTVKAGLSFSLELRKGLFFGYHRFAYFIFCCALDIFMSFSSRGLGCTLDPCAPQMGLQPWSVLLSLPQSQVQRPRVSPSDTCGRQQSMSQPMLWHCVCGYDQIPSPKWGGFICSPYRSQPRGWGAGLGAHEVAWGKEAANWQLTMEDHRAWVLVLLS